MPRWEPCSNLKFISMHYSDQEFTLKPDWVVGFLLAALVVIVIAIAGYCCDHHYKKQQAPAKEPVVQSRRIAVKTTPQADPGPGGHCRLQRSR